MDVYSEVNKNYQTTIVGVKYLLRVHQLFERVQVPRSVILARLNEDSVQQRTPILRRRYCLT